MNGIAARLSSRPNNVCRSGQSGAIDIRRGECRSYRQPSTLRCIHGRLWVTVEGDPVDYLVDPGQSMALPHGLSVVQALEASTLAIG